MQAMKVPDFASTIISKGSVSDMFCRSQYDPEIKSPKVNGSTICTESLWLIGAELTGTSSMIMRSGMHLACRRHFAELREEDDRRDGFQIRFFAKGWT